MTSGYEKRGPDCVRAARGDTPPRKDEAQRGPRPRRSAYENRRAAPSKVVTLMTVTGKFLGMEIDGVFQPATPCCPNPAECTREDCWTPINVPGLSIS